MMTTIGARDGALILAAGRGSRVGGPKALLLYDGVPLALAHAIARSADTCGVVVVLRRAVAAALAPFLDDIRLEGTRVRFVVSDEPEEDRGAGSIRAAVTSGALDRFDRILVSPVDLLPSPTSLVATLFDGLDDRHRASRLAFGHPVACEGRLLRDTYAREGSPPSLRDLLAGMSGSIRTLPVPAGVPVNDFDDVDAVVAATGAAPLFFCAS